MEQKRAVHSVLYGSGRPHRCCAVAFNDRRKPHRARVMRVIVTYFNLKYILKYIYIYVQKVPSPGLSRFLSLTKNSTANKCFTIYQIQNRELLILAVNY